MSPTESPKAVAAERTSCELADIVRRHGQAYRRTHRLSSAQRKAMWAIEHCIIASGALSPDGSRWIAGGRQFLFAVRSLSKVFRGKYLDGLADLLAEGLLDYLGRYTHRVAISNHRLVDCEDGEVTFRCRDRGDGDRVKEEVLSAEAFLTRFLQHVLPDSFLRVRHYGLLANRVKRKLLARCRQLLGCRASSKTDNQPRTAAEWMQHLLGIDVDRCPRCGEPLQRAPLLKLRPAPDPTYAPAPFPEFEAWNTS